MNIVIVMDSYKASISSKVADETVKYAIIQLDSQTQIDTFPLTNDDAKCCATHGTGVIVGTIKVSYL